LFFFWFALIAFRLSTSQWIVIRAPILTLADVIELALRDNRYLISSAFGVESQKFSTDVAQSEFEWKFFPRVTATATDDTSQIGGGLGVEKKFEPGIVASINPGIHRNYYGYFDEAFGSQIGISLTVPLLRGFGSEINLRGVQTAQYAIRTAKRSHYQVQVSTVLEAVAAVYNIVQQRKLVYLYQDQVKRLQGHAIMAAAREKIGLATPIDVYRAQIRLKDAQDSSNRAQENLRSAGDRLKIVLATPLEQTLQVVAPLDCPPVDIKISQAVETALEYRVELEQIDDAIKEAERDSRLAKNNVLPQLDLVANYISMDNDYTSAGASQFSDEIWSLNLVGKTDWSRTAEKAIYQQSQLTVKQVELNRLIRAENIKREVRQFFDALLKARERMRIRNDQIHEAEGKLALSKIKFDHAMADNFDLIEAETELQEARSNLLAAQIEYIVGMYRLRAAMGTLIE